MQEIRCLDKTYTQIPTYILGPFVINGDYAQGEYNIPFATLERPLLVGLNRGRKAAAASGAIDVKIVKDEMTRAPLLCTRSAEQARQIKCFINTHFSTLETLANETTCYGRLTSLEPVQYKADIYLRVGMFCGDAAGHNMTEKAAAAIIRYLTEKFPGTTLGALSSNYCIDKKPSLINIEKGRGKSTTVGIFIPDDILHRHLKTSAEQLIELHHKKNIIGSALAGSPAQNAHHANIIAAIFAATGQDLANIVEASHGKTSITQQEGGAYFGVEIPALIVGTVSAGAKEPYAQENLRLLGCADPTAAVGNNAKKLAEIITAATLVGELNLLASLTNDYDLLEAHLLYERNG